jgi:hypothetical protein
MLTYADVCGRMLGEGDDDERLLQSSYDFVRELVKSGAGSRLQSAGDDLQSAGETPHTHTHTSSYEFVRELVKSGAGSRESGPAFATAGVLYFCTSKASFLGVGMPLLGTRFTTCFSSASTKVHIRTQKLEEQAPTRTHL